MSTTKGLDGGAGAASMTAAAKRRQKTARRAFIKTSFDSAVDDRVFGQDLRLKPL